MTRCVALIVAAGRGHRAGQGLPKQYAPLMGEPLLRHTLRCFLDHPAVDETVVVIHPDDQALYEEAIGDLALPAPVHGGSERQDSVRNGLEALAAQAPDIVLIHDAARPHVSEDLIQDVIDQLQHSDAALPALPLVDTLKQADQGGQVTATVPRDGLWLAQTPQGFRFGAILSAHRSAAGQALTDDAAVAEAAGLTVVLTSGDAANIKLTTKEDFEETPSMQQPQRLPRIGSGFDVHRFTAGDKVTLCGVDIAHSQSLLGHSDADVAMHALTDALLGAIAAGDIGQHFPPSDPQWRGAPSERFLRHAADLIRERGGEIANCDLTIICERPKLGPHRTAMQARLAAILEIPQDRVSVKATTSEKLGFTGRGEGIAAMATATLVAA